MRRSRPGLVWLRRGHLDRAFGYLQPSLEACREKHLDVWRPIPASLLGLTQALAGRLDEALPLLRDGVHLSEVLGVNAYLALWMLNLAEGQMAAGQLDQARETARHALDLAVSHKERGHQAWAWRLLGDLDSRGDAAALAQAEENYRRALNTAEELRMQPVIAHAKMGLGRVMRLRGDRERAEEYLVTAFMMFRGMDVPFWVRRCGEEMMQLGEIFIVARYNPQLYEYLQRKFSHDERIRIIMDRRVGERRQRMEAATGERRQQDAAAVQGGRGLLSVTARTGNASHQIGGRDHHCSQIGFVRIVRAPHAMPEIRIGDIAACQCHDGDAEQLTCQHESISVIVR